MKWPEVIIYILALVTTIAMVLFIGINIGMQEEFIAVSKDLENSKESLSKCQVDLREANRGGLWPPPTSPYKLVLPHTHKKSQAIDATESDIDFYIIDPYGHMVPCRECLEFSDPHDNRPTK